MVRCKFVVAAIEDTLSPDTKAVTFVTRYDPNLPEDQRFTRWTPSGSMQVMIDNPRALAELKLGESYYIDITKV